MLAEKKLEAVFLVPLIIIGSLVLLLVFADLVNAYILNPNTAVDQDLIAGLRVETVGAFVTFLAIWLVERYIDNDEQEKRDLSERYDKLLKQQQALETKLDQVLAALATPPIEAQPEAAPPLTPAGTDPGDAPHARDSSPSPAPHPDHNPPDSPPHQSH